MSIISFLRKNKISDLGYAVSKRVYNYFSMRRRFTNKYEFINRQKGNENLFIILAGFQEYYWDVVSERVFANTDGQDVDVCVCIPQGLDTIKLKAICERYNWSYLRIEDDLLAQVQNVAIHLHKNAKWIYKIDEDIIIPNEYIINLKKTYLKALDNMPVEPGIVSPCININAYGVRPFLEAINKWDEFINLFGRFAFGGFCGLYHGDNIHSNPNVGKWITENTIPFANVSNIVSTQNAGKIGWCANRLSIGAILFTRDFWKRIGYFEVGLEGAMGLEEEQVNAFCIANNYGIYIAEDVFAAHLGFFKQKNIVREVFENNINSFRVC